MQTPIGPSLQLLLLMTAATEVALRGLEAGWQRWIGPNRFHRKLRQFARAGLVESTATHNTDRVLRLTDAGRLAALGGRDPEACWRRGSDGYWWLVIFDVPEAQMEKRQLLRRQLRRLGFGYLQYRAWISPDPVDRLKAAMGDSAVDVETLTFLESRPCAGETFG